MSVPTCVKTVHCGSNTIKQSYRNCVIKLFMSDKEIKALRMENNGDIFSKASIRVLRPTPPVIKNVPENFSPGIMRSGSETDHLSSFNVEI